MAMLLETLGFFTLLGILLGGFVFVLMSTQRQSKKQETAMADALKTKEEIEQKVQTLQNELIELRQELTLKNQMLEGLRGQYSELEKDYEKLRVKSEAEALKQPVTSLETPPSTGSPLINII